MLHFNVRRLTAAVALVLVLAAVPALAAPGPRPHAVPVASLSLLDRLLNYLGFAAKEGLSNSPAKCEKSTTGTPATSSTTDPKQSLSRGVLIDPNG